MKIKEKNWGDGCCSIYDIDSLKLEYARRLAMYELEVYGTDRDKYMDATQAKIRRYCMSTKNKRRFIMTACLAALNSEYHWVVNTRKEIGVSRAAIDTMVNDCEAANWIRVKRNKQNYRSIQATEVTLETWFNYADFVKSVSKKTGLAKLQAASEVLIELGNRS